MKHPFPRSLLLEFLLYAVLTAGMLHVTWLTWPDAFVDFSRELYLPWRVSCGDVLYRNLAYDFGPVSVYANAALFALLGRPSVHALFAFNFAFWIATLLALRALLRRIASPLAAALSVSSFILLFSFSRYLLNGNYNFIAPYSHELTRGLLWALLALLALDSALASPSGKGRAGFAPGLEASPWLPRAFRCLLPGFFYALVLFTKPELALASTASVVLLFVLHALRHRSFPLRGILAFALAAALVVALVVSPFALAFHSLSRALHAALLKLYLDCFNPGLAALPFYRELLGVDTPLPNACRLLSGVFWAALPFLLARAVFSSALPAALRGFAVAALSAAAAAIGWFAWKGLGAALPLAPLAILAILFWKHGRPPSRNPDSVFPLCAAFAVFALLLAAKMFLRARISHYGFVLLLPAFCCAVLLAFPFPRPRGLAILAVSMLLAFLAKGLSVQASVLRKASIRVPVFDGTFRTADFEARAFDSALSWIRSNTPPASTLAVLPEGAILNVLADRPNPTPYVYLGAAECLRFDGKAILDAYRTSPPDTLVLVAKIGEPQFGLDYAQDLMAFLDPLYSPVLAIPLSTPSGTIPYIVIARKSDPVGVLPDANRKL